MSTKITIDPPKPYEDPAEPIKGYEESTGRTYIRHSKPVHIGNRKIVNKPRFKPEVIEVHEAPDIEQMVKDGMAIISYELSQYRRKTEKGKQLDLKEARVVTSYVEVLTKLAKEARESKRPEALENLTTEQLIELAQQSLMKKNANHSAPLESSHSSLDSDSTKNLEQPLESNEDLKDLP